MRFPVSFKRNKGGSGSPTLGTDVLPTTKCGPGGTGPSLAGSSRSDNVLASRIVSINGWPLSRIAVAAAYDGAAATAALPVSCFAWDDALGFWVALPQSSATVAVGTPKTAPTVPAQATFFDAISLIDLPHVTSDLSSMTPGSLTVLCNIGDPGAGALNGNYTFGLAAELTANPFGGGAPPLDPTTIAGLTLWLRADRGITAPGGLVTTWADQSGLGNDFTAAGAQRPTFVASSTNGQPGLTFSQAPATQMLSAHPISSFFTTTDRTVFLAVKPTTAIDLFANPELTMPILNDTQTGGYFTTGFGTQGGVKKFYTNDFVPGDVTTITGTVVLGNAHILSNHKSGGNLSIAINGGADVTVACGAIQNMTHALSLGNQNGFSFIGDLLEVLVWNNDISAANKTAVKNYLNAKYAAF